VSTVSWECFSFRLGSCGGFWFVVFRPIFLSPCSSTYSTWRRFHCRAGSEGFSLGIVGWTVVEGFGAHGPIWCPSSIVPMTVGCAHLCLLVPMETINKLDKKKKQKRET